MICLNPSSDIFNGFYTNPEFSFSQRVDVAIIYTHALIWTMYLLCTKNVPIMLQIAMTIKIFYSIQPVTDRQLILE